LRPHSLCLRHSRNRVIFPPPLLAIDVGNSRIKYGWFEPEPGPGAAGTSLWPECRHFTVGPLTGPAPWDRIRTWTDPLVCGVVIAGSNPAVVEQMTTHWQSVTGREPWVVRDRHALPIDLEVDLPERVGLDRLLNAVAANRLRQPDEGAIVIDSGTATTFEVVTTTGAFAGGAILPGLALSSKALHDYTALLPELSLAELGPELPQALGKETRGALRSGIFWGHVGAIRELTQQICTSLEWQSPLAVFDPNDPRPRCRAILTGGGGPWLGAVFPELQPFPSLAMHGLVLAAWSNWKSWT
jgi:type III pantothenate kinase